MKRTMKRMMKLTIMMVMLSVVSGCAGITQIKPLRSEYFKTDQAEIVIDQSGVHYNMNYEVLRDLSEPVYVELQFENPQPGGEPLVVQRKVAPGERFLSVKSPMLPGIKNNKYYLTILKVYKDKSQTEQISVHRQYVDFSMLNAEIARQGVKQYP